MSKDGTPEDSTRRCGKLIARLRTARGWSRARLITRLCHELDPDDPQHEALGEAWLARLETGRTVKLQRATVEALCRALRCTPRERALLLLAADRSVLTERADTPTPEAELLNFVMDRLYAEARPALARLLAQRGAPDDELAFFEIAAAALAQVIDERRP
jgi:transcriptional regulator with XRE-family HTH domain